jgi:hypothetical protein
MSFFSRFLGDRKQEDDPLAGFDVEGEEQAEGLFMQAGPSRPAEPAFGPSVAFQDAAAAPGEPAGALEPKPPAAPDNVVAFQVAAEPETRAGDGEPAAEATADEEVSTGANDILAAFSASHSSGELGELAKEVDDVPVDELVTQLRELREIMKQRSGQ